MSESTPYGSHEHGAPPDPDEQARKVAAKRIKAKREFRSHLFSYVVVNAVISGIWLVIALTAGGGNWFPWNVFPLLGWGIGLAFHWRAAYGPVEGPIGEDEIDAELRRMRGQR